MFQERSGRMIQALSPRGSPSSSPPRDYSPSRSPSPPSRWAMPRTSPPSSPKGASASISSMSEGDEDEKWGWGARIGSDDSHTLITHEKWEWRARTRSEDSHTLITLTHTHTPFFFTCTLQQWRASPVYSRLKYCKFALCNRRSIASFSWAFLISNEFTWKPLIYSLQQRGDDVDVS